MFSKHSRSNIGVCDVVWIDFVAMIK